jgi:hypothetical protein
MTDEEKKKLWTSVKNKVDKRDGKKCRLIKALSAKEYMKLKKNAKGVMNRIDRAHVLPRSTRPDLIYDYENVVCLNHYSHINLDNCCSPLDGSRISKEEVVKWWKIIIGEDLYEVLLTKNKEGE